MSDHTATASTEKPSVLSNVLAIIGLIILAIIIIWGLVHLAELSSGWFSSLFQKSAPTLSIDAPSDAISGAPVTISWNNPATAEGTYAFLYQCQQGLQFAVINASDNTATGIPCGTAASVTPISGAIQMLPLLSGTTSASVPFSVIFTPATGAAVQGSATMTIHPSSVQTATQSGSQAGSQATTQTSTQTSKPTTMPSSTYSAPRTPADLYVHIVSVRVDQYGNGVVTFNIQNIGGTTSGPYYFSAEMPTSTPTPYTSALQAPLTPGSYISDTLRFSPAVSGTFSVAIGTRDANQANDYASVWINAPTIYNPYNVQYQTQPYTY